MNTLYKLYQPSFISQALLRTSGKRPEPSPAIEKVRHFVYGSKAWSPQLINEYQHVATIEATSLEHAFCVGNGMGEGFYNLHKHKPMVSMSVGDIIVDKKRPSHMWMVEGSGFSRIHTNPIKHYASRAFRASRVMRRIRRQS